jgi:hypothetical protein
LKGLLWHFFLLFIYLYNTDGSHLLPFAPGLFGIVNNTIGMMNLQYIADKSGHTTAVQIQIPIEEWDQLKKKYKELEEEENAAASVIPDWQIKLGKEELHNIASGNTVLLEWNEARKQLKR